MTIIQPTKPPDITPDKWTSEIWHYILKFLQPLDASFLFYSAINGAESLDANRKQEALNAANVDKIMQMQRNQFLTQASYLNFDPETQSPFKIKTPGGQQAQETMELANEAGVKIETINFIKLPPGLHGLKALQLALHELLCTMGKANYSATTSLVSITSETCGTDLLNRLNNTISHGDVKAIPTKLVLRIKLKSDDTVEKYKVRCVALGFLQRAGLHYHPDECYSPMSDPSTTRTLVALSNALDLNIDHLDVAVAYLNGVLPTDQRFFCLPPPGFEETAGYGWYMLKGLYGTKQGGALWAKTFRDWMRREQPQFIEAGNERVCYVFREGYDGAPIDLDKLRGLTLEPNEKLIILCMNTDDMLIAYTDSARHLVDEFERSLNASYTSTPRTPLEYYLGMHVQRDRENRVLSIDVRRHIYDFIRSMGLDPFSSASVSTPLDPNVLFSKADCPPVIDAEIKERVLRAHGKLIHMAIWARPDLAHCVSVLGRYVHNPSQKHLDAYLRVARYLIKTKDLRIVYGTHDTHGLVLYGFSDSDWGADPDSYRSTGAYIFFLDGAACSWKVKLSSTALLSSQESEYVAGSEATKEALNLRMLLEHLGFGDPRPTDIYVDNKGAITMGLHPANKPATRHVNMRMHMLRQHVELGHVSTPFCPTFDMVADYMTKATPKPTHERHNARTMGSQSLAPPLTLIQHLID